MQKAVYKLWCLSIGVLLFAGHSAFAESVTITLTSAGGVAMGGVYVNPYTARVDGVSTTVICDDFADDTYVNETWQATTTSYADLGTTLNTNVMWDSFSTAAEQLQAYNAAASLTLQLLSETNSVTKGEISYAIWGIFDPGAITWLNGYSSTYATAAQGYINSAMAQTYTPGQFSNFVIYTPVAGSATCSGGPCPNPRPQEMLAIAMPEPSLAALLVVDLAALFGLVVLLRRRLARA
jgi:hypothetical protein